MSDDFDLRLARELRALADAVPTSKAADVAHPVERLAPSRVTARSRGGRPVALSLASLTLVAVVVAGAAIYGTWRLGQTTASPGANASPSTSIGPTPTAADTGPVPTTILPHVVASFGSDEMGSLVRVGTAAFVIDRTDDSIYSIDLVSGAKVKAITAGTDLGQTGTFGKPLLLGSGPGVVYALDGSGHVWRLAPGRLPKTNAIGFIVLDTLSRVDATAWGPNVRAIGTDASDSSGGLIYAVVPAQRQVERYLLGNELVGLNPDYLEAPRDVSSVDDMYIDGHLYLASAGKVLRFTGGRLDYGWTPGLPAETTSANVPFFSLLAADSTSPDQGLLYAYDRHNRRIDAFDKADGSLVGHYEVPADSPLLADAKGMFVTTDAGGHPTVFWLEGGDLLSASLSPAGEPTPAALSNCSRPATYSQTIASGRPVAIEPKTAVSFGGDALGAAVYGAGGDAYVIDQTNATVYRVDLGTGAKKAVAVAGQKVASVGAAGDDVVGAPRLLAVGGPDVLILDDANAVWRWRPAPVGFEGSLTRLQVDDASNWGTGARGIGTFLTDSALGEYSLYAAIPAAQQVLLYPAAPDGSGYRASGRTDFLTVPRDLDTLDDMLVESNDRLYLVQNGSFSRCITGSTNLAWRITLPADSGDKPPFYARLLMDDTIVGEGNLYAYDSANRRIDLFRKADGTYFGRLVPPEGSTWLAHVGGMFIQRHLDGAMTLYWTESGNLMRAVLPSSAGAPN
jgi:hypothetical protein